MYYRLTRNLHDLLPRPPGAGIGHLRARLLRCWGLSPGPLANDLHSQPLVQWSNMEPQPWGQRVPLPVAGGSKDDFSGSLLPGLCPPVPHWLGRSKPCLFRWAQQGGGALWRTHGARRGINNGRVARSSTGAAGEGAKRKFYWRQREGGPRLAHRRRLSPGAAGGRAERETVVGRESRGLGQVWRGVRRL